MITSLALSLIAIASGTLLTYTYDDDAPLAARLCSGACIGFAVMGLAGFILAMCLGLNPLTIGLTAVVLLLPVGLLKRPDIRKQLNADIDAVLKAISRASSKPDRWAFIYFLFYAGVLIVMWLVFDRALLYRPDGLATGVLNNYGDLPFHLSVITRFAFGQNFPPEDPTFSGVRFTYPFLTDFISAIFVRSGADLRQSLFIENWIIGVAMVGVLHRFALRLLHNRTAAILTPLLIILNGGLGWTMLFSDINRSDGGIFQILRNMQHSYTIIPDLAAGWRWGGSITTLLIPQRGFLLGIPLAVIVFTQWWQSMEGAKGEAQSAKVKGPRARNDKSQISNPKSQISNAHNAAGDGHYSGRFALGTLPMRRMLAAGVIAGAIFGSTDATYS